MITLEIKVIPSSGKQLITTDKSGKIKCYLKSPPEKGKANKELIKLLSKKLSIPQDEIQIISGAISRLKRVRINAEGRLDEILAQLGIEIQMKI